MATVNRLLQKTLLSLIGIYRYFLSPWVGRQCRFHPSCSSYAKEAIEVYGPLKGCLLSLRRLSRCHPWQAGGIDFVPLKK